MVLQCHDTADVGAAPRLNPRWLTKLGCEVPVNYFMGKDGQHFDQSFASTSLSFQGGCQGDGNLPGTRQSNGPQTQTKRSLVLALRP